MKNTTRPASRFANAPIAAAALFTAIATLSAQAGAQPRPTGTASPLSSASPGTDLNETTEMPTTPVPAVSDPMLTPPADSPKKISTWTDALSLVRSRSPDYLASFQNIKRAEAQSRQALAALLPNVTGQGTYTHNFLQAEIPFSGTVLVTPPPNVWNASVGAGWTPINARAYFDWQSTKSNTEAAKLTFEDKRRQIASAMVGAMLATLSSARVAELNRVGLKTALERLHLTEARLQYGQGTPLDVDRAQADAAASRRQIIDGDESLKRARENLGVALGSREPITVATDLDLEGFERAVAQTCHLNDNIEKRPDVAAAKERVTAARRMVTSAELAPLPTLGVGSTAAYSDSPLLGPNGTVSVQAILTVPFYDGGLRYGQLREARALEEQAVQALEATRLDAIVSAAQKRRGVDTSRADRDVSKTERDLAERIDMRTREAYARGRGTSLDLVTSAQALRQAEINLAILEFQLAEARADAVLENAECAF